MNKQSQAFVQLMVSLALIWGYVLTDWVWLASASLGCLVWAVGFQLWPSRKITVGPDKSATSKPVGILPLAEFAEKCDALLRVKPEEAPEPPSALPVGLRDAGFAESRAQRRELTAELFNGEHYELERRRRHEMDMLRFRHPRFHDEVIINRSEPKLRPADRAKVDAIPLVAHRPYVALTHCPEGHIGDHWLGTVTDSGMVERTCRYEKCGATWQEKAWTTAA